MSRSSQIQPQHGVSVAISRNNTTTTTTTSRHLYHQQEYEMQSMRSSGNSSMWANTYAMYQPHREAVQEHNTQVDIRPGGTQIELLRRELLEFGLPPDLLHEVGHSSQNARTARARADTFVLRNQTTQELTEVLFDQASSGVTHNVAVRSQQFNTAVGPGSRVSRNRATDSEQNNCSVCVVM